MNGSLGRPILGVIWLIPIITIKYREAHNSRSSAGLPQQLQQNIEWYANLF